MVIDYRKSRRPEPVMLKDRAVERTTCYKYLGVVLDNELCWHEHVDSIVTKMNYRMFCLRKLNLFHVNRNILATFYDTVVASVWSYCLVCWGGNARGIAKDRINRIIRAAGRILGESRPLVDTAYGDLLPGKLKMLLNDANHPLHDALASRLIPRSCHMRVPYSATNR